MQKELSDVLFKEEEKMYIDDEEFKTQLISKLEEDIVNFSSFERRILSFALEFEEGRNEKKL